MIRPYFSAAGLSALLSVVSILSAHEWHRSAVPAPGPEREALRAQLLEEWTRQHAGPGGVAAANAVPSGVNPVMLASTESSFSTLRLAFAAAISASPGLAPPQAAAFQKFPMLQLCWDASYLYIGGNGIPSHNMMVGITNWQQQVPRPQAYFGANAWRLPLHPVPAQVPASIKNRFLRGAIAIAVNGIPIFNPQNNRGEISQEIGELDQWGGHCGRADDYHYHRAPLHLQAVVGKGLPIAYALDGYPIYGITEPDGSLPTDLDVFHGHETAALGYHYHASTRYPYVNGGFHGEVVELGNQVDPQPRAQPIRAAMGPLRGATITDFTTSDEGKSRSLHYTVNGRQGSVNYSQLGDGSWKFQFVSADGQTDEQTYRPGEHPGGARRPDEPGEPPRPGAPARENAPAPAPSTPGAQASKGSFVLTSPEVMDGGNLPVDYTGDGSGSTPPLEWSGAPPSANNYVLVMHHVDREGKMKWYWIIYNIPANVHSLPKNVEGIGTVGTGFKGRIGYEPPHSQGPGPKTYVLTLYALSAPADVTVLPARVSYDVIMEAMKGKILASADLRVVHTSRGGNSSRDPADGARPRRPQPGEGDPPRSPSER